MNLPKQLAAAAILVAALAAPALAQQKHAPPTPEQRAARFDKADANKDGLLTKAEFTAAISPERQGRVDKMWSRLDPTGKDEHQQGGLSRRADGPRTPPRRLGQMRRYA